jgi:hypothetical protein
MLKNIWALNTFGAGQLQEVLIVLGSLNMCSVRLVLTFQGYLVTNRILEPEFLCIMYRKVTWYLGVTLLTMSAFILAAGNISMPHKRVML